MWLALQSPLHFYWAVWPRGPLRGPREHLQSLVSSPCFLESTSGRLMRGSEMPEEGPGRSDSQPQ